METTMYYPDQNLKQKQVEFYTRVAEGFGQSDLFSTYGTLFTHMNYGYKPNSNKQYSRIQLPERCINKCFINLALEVIGDADLDGKKIIEVGSGRGGNVIVMKKYFKPGPIIGMDICKASIGYCRSYHPLDNVTWQVGDAECLSFKDNSFDLVFNLESSHAYPHLNKFYDETFRVLGPGGIFLYSDLFDIQIFPVRKQYLQDLGFIVQYDRDITSNVLLSCQEGEKSRMALYPAQPDDKEALIDFLGAPGSRNYRDLENGDKTYRILKLKKYDNHEKRKC